MPNTLAPSPDEIIAELRRQLEERNHLVARLELALVTTIESCDRFDRHIDLRLMLTTMLGWCALT